MAQETLPPRLLHIFLAELGERTRAMDRDLLELESATTNAGRSALVASLFREAHSLKGASRSIGLTALEALCHGMESQLAAVRDGEREATPGLLQGLFSALDRVKAQGDILREGRPLDEAGLATEVSKLKSGGEARTPTHAARIETKPVSAADPPRAERDTNFVRLRSDKLDALLAHESDLLAMRTLAKSWPRALEDIEHMLRGGRRRHARQTATRRNSARRGAHAARGVEEALQTFTNAIEARLGTLRQSLESGGARIARTTESISAELLALRMVHFGEACEGLARIVRDLASNQGKSIRLQIQGEETELDRTIIQMLRDPLVHLVRNAVEHGIRTPVERKRAGMPVEAHIRISADLLGDRVRIAVEDDGAGLDLAAIREKARALGLGESQDEREKTRMVLLAGFSTATEVTEVSGRGVGLDVVRERIERAHGTIDLFSTPGKGLRVEMILPLTLLMQRGLVVHCGGESLVLLEDAVERVLLRERDSFQVTGDSETISFNGQRVRVVPLAALLGFDESAIQRSPAGQVPVIVARAGIRLVALIVDGFGFVETVVVKRAARQAEEQGLVSGACELADGRPALVLNATALIDRAVESPAAGLTRGPMEPEASKPRLLLAEDSITTRTLIKSLLESAGFDVMAVADGNAAWNLLQERPFEMVVSDIQMPECTGFELLERLRSRRNLRNLPVILLTSLESDEDKRRGMELGANAYLIKRTFDQTELIRCIRQWV